MSEQPMNSKAQPLLAKISTNFPELTWQSYRYIDEGWDHEVLILDDRLVFRFPIDDEYKNMLETEVAILNYFKDRLAIRIPNYTYVSSDKTFAGYSLISGDQLTKAHFDNLDSGTQDALAKQLAGFLTTIHTDTRKDLVFANVNNSYLEADQKEIKQQIKTLKGILGQADFAVVETILSDIDTLLNKRLPTVFIHNDVYSRHLLWDETSNKLGILDFSDMCFGDPAVDFSEIHEYGFDFAQNVYSYYKGPKDETFLKRAWSYQKWIAVSMMSDYFENHKTTFETARETFDRVKSQGI